MVDEPATMAELLARDPDFWVDVLVAAAKSGYWSGVLSGIRETYGGEGEQEEAWSWFEGGTYDKVARQLKRAEERERRIKTELPGSWLSDVPDPCFGMLLKAKVPSAGASEAIQRHVYLAFYCEGAVAVYREEDSEKRSFYEEERVKELIRYYAVSSPNLKP